MTPTGPCIIIYNPISGHGHLDSWNALFVSFLLQKGWRVIALTPDVDALRARLAGKGLASLPSLQIIPWDDLQRTFVQKVLGRVKRLFTQQKPSNQEDPEANYLKPLEFAQRVNKARKQTKWQPEVVFNMYMDLYRTDVKHWQAFEEAFELPWSGIRFVPRQDPTEAYYQSLSLFGMCFLDENISEQYGVSLPHKTFEYLPDITESALPLQPSDIAQTIKGRAAGRKIVFLGGTIGGGKNLARWYELIQRADPEKWFFLQIGEVHENSLSPDDIVARQRVMGDMPENLLIHPEYLPDEKKFNEIIQLSDVLFAVYRHFKISSNMLGKAAAFDRPILVAKDYLMGQRVTAYGIGRAVPEDDVVQMQAALEMLVSEGHSEQMRQGFQAYRLDFSIDALQHRFVSYLNKGLTPHVEDRS